MAGHQADVLSLCPSYTDSHSTGGGGGPLLLTAAADHTARLWALNGSHAGADLICFDRLRTNAKPPQREENAPLEQVQDAQFLCLDSAIALALGSRLGIYKYELHVQDANDDIKRLQRLGSYKCCGILSLPKEPSSGNSIVAVAASNSVMSGTVLVASSSKRIYVWDVAAEKVLAAVPEASMHTRPITCLQLAQPHAEFQSAQSMDLFYTAAMDGTAKLWDLRSMQECRCFEGGHTHAGQRLRCRLSPCLRFLCAPSEDGSVCAYDVRTGRVLGSRHCHRDAVCAVDIHPRMGGLASGGFDGKVHFHRAPLPGAPRKAGGRGPGNLVEGPGIERVREARVREVEMDLPM
uniref:Target of rapamycin complex subunit LST8 n=1 Tax=Pyrodinium bahamense TaxID=73915 RepID=A0A7S0F885_9DINO